jgi:predicted ATPase
MATHAPILMAYPGATLLRLTKYGLEPVSLRETDHYRLMREFCLDPKTFIETMMEE